MRSCASTCSVSKELPRAEQRNQIINERDSGDSTEHIFDARNHRVPPVLKMNLADGTEEATVFRTQAPPQRIRDRSLAFVVVFFDSDILIAGRVQTVRPLPSIANHEWYSLVWIERCSFLTCGNAR